MDKNTINWQRFKDLYKEKKKEGKFKNKEEFAEKIGYSRPQLYRFEKGIVKPDNVTVKRIAEVLETTVEYLKDETEIKGKKEYWLWLERVEDEALSSFQNEEYAKRKKIETMFMVYGYKYSDLSLTSAFEFQEFSDESYRGPHLIVPIDNESQKTYLTDEELSEFVNSLQEMANFKIYQFQAKARRENGNS